MKLMSDSPLRLGDALLIKLDGQNAFLIRSVGIHGDGLSIVELQEPDPHDTESPSVRYPPDLVDAVFVLCPAGKHTSAARLKNLETQLDTDADGIISEEEITAMMRSDCNDEIKAAAAKLSTIRAEAESEKIINETTTRQLTGTVLTFGDMVQLRHLASDKCISSLTLPGTRNQVSLLEDGLPSMVFVITPCYKSNQMGDAVFGQSFFTLRALETGQYIVKTSLTPPALEHTHIWYGKSSQR